MNLNPTGEGRLNLLKMASWLPQWGCLETRSRFAVPPAGRLRRSRFPLDIIGGILSLNSASNG